MSLPKDSRCLHAMLRLPEGSVRGRNEVAKDCSIVVFEIYGNLRQLDVHNKECRVLQWMVSLLVIEGSSWCCPDKEVYNLSKHDKMAG